MLSLRARHTRAAHGTVAAGAGDCTRCFPRGLGWRGARSQHGTRPAAPGTLALGNGLGLGLGLVKSAFPRTVAPNSLKCWRLMLTGVRDPALARELEQNTRHARLFAFKRRMLALRMTLSSFRESIIPTILATCTAYMISEAVDEALIYQLLDQPTCVPDAVRKQLPAVIDSGLNASAMSAAAIALSSEKLAESLDDASGSIDPTQGEATAFVRRGAWYNSSVAIRHGARNAVVIFPVEGKSKACDVTARFSRSGGPTFAAWLPIAMATATGKDDTPAFELLSLTAVVGYDGGIPRRLDLLAPKRERSAETTERPRKSWWHLW